VTDYTRREFGKLLAAAPLALGHGLVRSPEAGAGPLPRPAPPRRLHGTAGEITLLYTNDFHSAFEPIPAYWLQGSPRLGGAAHLAALVERERAAAATSFLLDSGDMFTGTLSRLTQGEALLEMMRVMRYDAMSVGNHEFDYGWQAFSHGMNRVPFPVLCCNIRHRGTGIPYTRPYTILERNGARLGVIGVMGMKCATQTIMPSKVADLEFTDPAEETAACVALLRDDVDVVVVLGHQGLPGAMQTDAENDPEVQRSLDEDLAFCGAVPGIDLYIAAHSHHGLDEPLVHPDTGTLLTQTYGYGTRLGRVRLQVRDRKVVDRDVELLKVWSDELAPNPEVTDRVARYRDRIADEIGPPFARAAERITRRYHHESPLGSLCTDALRARARSDVAFTNAGGLRADLPQGPLHRGHVLDALPFLNDAVTLVLPGGEIRGILEQGFSLAAGMIQVSGLRAWYDPARPMGTRLIRAEIGGEPLDPERRYLVTTNTFLEQGGDGYTSFRRGTVVSRDVVLSDIVADHIRQAGVVSAPPTGRLVAV
jgi:2',3'-cyclic-nucleotide 2'-phosphodiesterase (5'-nucleotidase family)